MLILNGIHDMRQSILFMRYGHQIYLQYRIKILDFRLSSVVSPSR